ncbi:MAG TPA: class I SAM-dependent methyltransferase [Rhodothermales bacterium]|nr:class I SAM-dependent methyltransferase [Rhodothermales bacterium]
MSNAKLKEWTRSVFEHDRERRIVVNELKELIKTGAPPVERLRIEPRRDGAFGFEHLTALFASNTLNEYVITMNLRQSAYLFDLIRRSKAEKVIEIGRHWGGSTVLIATAMDGRGEFWSIADPHETDWDVEHRGRPRPRPIADQLCDLLGQLGLSAHLISGDPATVEVETGEVDLVHIDGAHSYTAAMTDFERFGRRVRVGGAVLLDDAVPDPFSDLARTADVKQVVADIVDRGDFRVVATIQRLMHLERVRKDGDGSR